MRVAKRLNSPFIIAIIVFVVCSSATYFAWKSSDEKNQGNKASDVEDYTSDFISSLQTRVDAIAEMSRGIISFTASQEYTKDKLSNYIDSLKISERYPSINTIGLISVINKKDLASFTLQNVEKGFSPFTISPPGIRDTYIPVTFLKSISNNAGDNAVLGYDLQTEPNLNNLLNDARDSGRPSLSNILTLTDSNTQTIQPGVALMAPMYLAATSNLNDRQKYISGYVFVSLRTRPLIQKVIPVSKNLSATVYEGKNVDEDHLIYGNHQSAIKNNLYKKTFNLRGKDWTIVVSNEGDRYSKTQRASHLLLYLGITLSALLALFLLYVMRSKTREVELQKQLELRSAKEDLLALASHQLRTPATSVKQYLGMLKEGYAGALTNEQQEMLIKAYESNERQLGIVAHILNLSKLESQGMVLNPEEVNLPNIINNIIGEQQILLRDRVVTVDVEPKVSNIFVDPVYFPMVLENIICNAAKYSPEGTPIEINVRSTNEGTFIDIIDHGIGIAKKDFPKLFLLFSRIDNESTISVTGTGLGLYIARLITRLHGGYIELESEPDDGSIFSVYIPKDSDNLED